MRRQQLSDVEPPKAIKACAQSRRARSRHNSPPVPGERVTKRGERVTKRGERATKRKEGRPVPPRTSPSLAPRAGRASLGSRLLAGSFVSSAELRSCVAAWEAAATQPTQSGCSHWRRSDARSTSASAVWSTGREPWRTVLRCLLRPVQITVGCGGMLLGLLVWLSLLLVSIDKALHSLGYKMGYLLPKASLPNPLDMALVQSQKVFPIDYVLYLAVVLYLVMCTVYGIRKMGICWSKRTLPAQMYRIRPGRTRPQGILLLCLSLMFAVLALNVLLYSVCPQYTTFGSQHYLSQARPCAKCGLADCVMTRASALLLRFFYKAWVFGACYFWATVLLCASYVVAFVVVIARGRQSAVEVDTDDLDGSDNEDLLRA
ncbi:hypothetical protein HPB47_005759 [Ixodes persulcatus]|uniref:Uncharacterized protein n=1 Tax=Ixodes persulcatus TaxID=34615 RepID=A0AC60PCY0_IXOPE|nr:hypothetical protein HPB47_005759 [Ixodes persulcatus]